MQFKVSALATTSLAALALATAPANAKSGMTGVVNLGTGHTWQDQDNAPDIDDQFMNVFGGAQVNIPYSDNVNVQIDVNGDSAYANEEDDNNFGTAFTAGLHVNYSNEDGFLGVFGATGRTSGIDENTTSFYAAGFEGQWTCETWIVGGQIGWLDTSGEDDSGIDDDYLSNAGFIRAHGTWFASPKLAVGAALAYVDGEQDTVDDAVLWEWTVTAEKMVGTNTSVFVEYRGVDVEESGTDDDEFDSHTLSAGFRFHFNATDLYSSAVEGPSAHALRFGRWVSEAGEQID